MKKDTAYLIIGNNSEDCLHHFNEGEIVVGLGDSQDGCGRYEDENGQAQYVADADVFELGEI